MLWRGSHGALPSYRPLCALLLWTTYTIAFQGLRNSEHHRYITGRYLKPAPFFPYFILIGATCPRRVQPTSQSLLRRRRHATGSTVHRYCAYVFLNIASKTGVRPNVAKTRVWWRRSVSIPEFPVTITPEKAIQVIGSPTGHIQASKNNLKSQRSRQIRLGNALVDIGCKRTTSTVRCCKGRATSI